MAMLAMTILVLFWVLNGAIGPSTRTTRSNLRHYRGVVAWMFFLGLSFKSHWRLPIPKQNRGWLLYFYHSGFDFFFYAPNCRNLPELAFACCVVFEKKIGPDSEGGILWMHLLVGDYNLRHGE